MPTPQEIKWIQVLLKDLKSLQHDGGKIEDLKFNLKDGHGVKVHPLIIKARYSYIWKMSSMFSILRRIIFLNVRVAIFESRVLVLVSIPYKMSLYAFAGSNI